MVLIYNPNDCYWSVAGDLTRVWYSGTMEYVPIDDVGYTGWIRRDGHITSINPAALDLFEVMVTQALPGYFSNGLHVSSSGTPSMNATYSLTPDNVAYVREAARDVASGLGLPMGGTTLMVTDIAGAAHAVPEASVVDLYKVMRDYMTLTTDVIQSRLLDGSSTLPANTASIA